MAGTTLRHARICELLLFHFDVFRLSCYNFRTIVEFVICCLLMYVWLQYTLKEIWTQLYNIDFVICSSLKYMCMIVDFFFFFFKERKILFWGLKDPSVTLSFFHLFTLVLRFLEKHTHTQLFSPFYTCFEVLRKTHTQSDFFIHFSRVLTLEKDFFFFFGGGCCTLTWASCKADMCCLAHGLMGRLLPTTIL